MNEEEKKTSCCNLLRFTNRLVYTHSHTTSTSNREKYATQMRRGGEEQMLEKAKKINALPIWFRWANARYQQLIHMLPSSTYLMWTFFFRQQQLFLFFFFRLEWKTSIWNRIENDSWANKIIVCELFIRFDYFRYFCASTNESKFFFYFSFASLRNGEYKPIYTNLFGTHACPSRRNISHDKN